LVTVLVAVTAIAAAGLTIRHEVPPTGHHDEFSAVSLPLTRTTVAGLHHYEYVFTDGYFDVYDMDKHFAHVGHVLTPQTSAGVRGESATAVTHMLYISYGGWGGGNEGGMLEYNLKTKSIVYAKNYPFGVDSMDISANGKTIYMPTGENDLGNAWKVISALTGKVIGTMHGGTGPHNTVVGKSGRVFLGSRANAGDPNGSSSYLYAARGSRPFGNVGKRIGPLKPNVRPFVINHAETLAFTTATGFLGFQVSSITSGKVLYTVPASNPCGCSGPWSTPSHGIAISPDEKELWLLDAANNELHVFDISRLPSVAPHETYTYRLRGNLSGNENPCNPVWCGKIGWINMSRDGRYVFVGDAGDVVKRSTRSYTTTIPALANSRQNIEIDWRNGTPVAAWSRESNGFG
jgi:hypothetical protein